MAMELSDEILIPAPRDRVYAALNNTDILQKCIPGCEELIRHSDTDLEAKVVLKIGPVKARFGGKVTLDQSNAPGGFSLSGEGSGGVAGFAKGGATVTLTETEGGTLLKYDARADVGGKIAQLGSRLIMGTAKKLADSFFTTFAEEVTKAEEDLTS
jgi:carbon monoxide dehydrogenase subunit G